MTMTPLARAMEKVYNELSKKTKVLNKWFAPDFIEDGEYINMMFADLKMVASFLEDIEIIPETKVIPKLLRLNEVVGATELLTKSENGSKFLRGSVYSLHFFAPAEKIIQISLNINNNFELFRVSEDELSI